MSNRIFIGFNHHYPNATGGYTIKYDRSGRPNRKIIHLKDGTSINEPDYQRSDFEIYIPIVAEQFGLPGEPSTTEKVAILEKYENELRDILKKANSNRFILVDKFSDCGPRAPWPILTVILLIPPAIYYSIKIIQEIRQWAKKKEKEPIFSMAFLLTEASIKLSEQYKESVPVHIGTWARKRLSQNQLEHAVTYTFLFQDTRIINTWYAVNILSSGETLDVRKIECHPQELEDAMNKVLEEMSCLRSEYIDTCCHDCALPSAQSFATKKSAQKFKDDIEELFPSYNFEIVKKNNWWEVRVAISKIQVPTREEAVQKKLRLEAMFFDRKFTIIPYPKKENPEYYIIDEVSAHQ